MDLACTIEARSKASASSGPISWTKNERWILSEWLVARQRVARGEELIAHRLKTPFAEVDLLFRRGRSYVVVEVKSWNESLYGAYSAGDVLSKRQSERLERARQYLSIESGGKTVALEIAVVSHRRFAEPVVREFAPPVIGHGY